LFLEAVRKYGSESIGVALDSRAGMITTHGWREESTHSAIEFGSLMRQRGVRHALYTDVARDGMLRGADIDGTITLAKETQLRVIASGGVSALSEIRQLAASGMVAGAIVGMALYQDRFSLPAAIAAAKEGNRC
jgi:phosphoribosylformimino-5-aminoimidazole carboxamide ribotide isomerase